MTADNGERGPQRFVPKLAPVEAMRWTGDNWDAISRWVYGEVVAIADPDYDGDKWPVAVDAHLLSVLEKAAGEVVASPDDWLIKDENGDWFVGDDDTFRRAYKVEPSGGSAQ